MNGNNTIKAMTENDTIGQWMKMIHKAMMDNTYRQWWKWTIGPMMRNNTIRANDGK